VVESGKKFIGNGKCMLIDVEDLECGNIKTVMNMERHFVRNTRSRFHFLW
jgi:hypothetical protein